MDSTQTKQYPTPQPRIPAPPPPPQKKKILCPFYIFESLCNKSLYFFSNHSCLFFEEYDNRVKYSWAKVCGKETFLEVFVV